MPDRSNGKKTLERLANETGAGFFEVSHKHPIDKIYASIEEELRNQYDLGYTPDGSSGSGFRHIKLMAKGKGLVVRSREGYYAKEAKTS